MDSRHLCLQNYREFAYPFKETDFLFGAFWILEELLSLPIHFCTGIVFHLKLDVSKVEHLINRLVAVGNMCSAERLANRHSIWTWLRVFFLLCTLINGLMSWPGYCYFVKGNSNTELQCYNVGFWSHELDCITSILCYVKSCHAVALVLMPSFCGLTN